MKEYDYIIIGGGCAGLSLAYELDLHKKLKNKKLVIIDPRTNYKRDKTWSYWKVINHNFEDCVKKSWDRFYVTESFGKTNESDCSSHPYQSIDSEKFYQKILKRLKKNKNIFFKKKLNKTYFKDSIVFNSVPTIKKFNGDRKNYWQHFYGIEIEFKTKKDPKLFDKFDLMNFACDQRNAVHFNYILPFKNNRMLIETTWFSKYDKKLFDYPKQIEQCLWDYMRLKKSDYKIKYTEKGAIPLFPVHQQNKKNFINIGTAGGMTRVSTGYTFLNIQEHSKYIRMNIDNINEVNRFQIKKKYYFFDKIFMKVLDRYPEIMPKLFYNLFGTFNNSIIKFLSNKSNFIDDIIVIFKMPKWIFIKSFFN